MNTIQAVSSVGLLMSALVAFAVYLLQRRGEAHRESTDALNTQAAIATSATAFAERLQEEIHVLRKQMEDLPQLRLDLASAQEQIRRLQSDLSLRTTRIEELERQLAVKTHELATMHEQYRVLEQRFTTLAAENTALYAEIGRLRTNMQQVAFPPDATTATMVTPVAVLATTAPMPAPTAPVSPVQAAPVTPAPKRTRRPRTTAKAPSNT